MYIHDIGLSASTNTLTQFCVHYSIPRTNIMLNLYVVRVRENAVAADVVNDICTRMRLPSPLPIRRGAGRGREP